MIRVKVERCIDLHQTKASQTVGPGLKPDLSIAEKALKGRAVSDGTTYSPGIKTKLPRTMVVDYLDTQKRPYAVFDFHYRSRGGLGSFHSTLRSRVMSYLLMTDA